MKNLNHIRKALLTAVLLITAVVTYAQNTAADSVQFCKVSLTNGNVVTGILISQDSANVTVNNSALGTLTILKSNVETVEAVEVGATYSFTMSTGKVYRGSVVRQDANSITILIGSSRMGLITANITDFSAGTVTPSTVEKRVDHGSRYLIAPSAIPLKKGDGYYHNACILVNGWHYGLTDRWSVGGGVVFPVGMYGQFKYGHQVAEKLHVAAGGMFVTTFFDLGVGVACGFGSVTWGDRYTNATFSIGCGGVGSGNNGWDVTSRPILNFSGMARLSDNVSLITENYLFPIQKNRHHANGESTTSNTYHPQLSAGFRIGGGRHSFDIAAMTIGDITEGNVFAVPFVGYAYRFSDKQ